MGLRRFQNWQIVMDQFMHDAASRPFAFGEWDCCLFTLAHVDAITGSAHEAAFAGLCHDAESAATVLEGMGGLEQAVTDLFGPPLAVTAKAQRGDIVLYESGQGPALGVVGLSGTHFCTVAAGETGLARFRMARALRAWRV